MHFPSDRTAHTTAFDGPVVVHWLKENSPNCKCPHHAGSIRHPNLYSSMLYHLSYAPPCILSKIERCRYSLRLYSLRVYSLRLPSLRLYSLRAYSEKILSQSVLLRLHAASSLRLSLILYFVRLYSNIILSKIVL